MECDLERTRETTMLRIKCLHCLKTFQDPRELPCGHSFCLHCLESIFAASLNLGSFSRHRTSLPFLRRSAGCFLCPTCTTLINVPALGVTAFPRAPSVEDVKKLAVEEMSKILKMKYRRRTTGYAISGQDISFKGNFSGDNLMMEENEEENIKCEDLRNLNRHSYPSSKVSDSLSFDSSHNFAQQPFPKPEENFSQFERSRRIRKSNKNLRSNLKPTLEYSGTSSIKQFGENVNDMEETRPEICVKTDQDFVLKSDIEQSCLSPVANDLDDPEIFGDEKKDCLEDALPNIKNNFVSNTQSCLNLRGKIRHDRYAGTFDPAHQDTSRRLFTSNFSPSGNESRRQYSTSFESSNEDKNQDISRNRSSRFKSAPENISNIFFESNKNFLLKEESPKDARHNRERSSFGSFTNFRNKATQNIQTCTSSAQNCDESKHVGFSEEEIKERLIKYRETSENFGSAKLIRILEKPFGLPSAISELPNKCLAVADYGCDSVSIINGSWSAVRHISGLKPFGLAYSNSSGNLFVTDRRSKTVLIYNPISGDKKGIWRTDAFGWICSVAIVNDTGNSEQLALLDRSTSSIRIYDIETERPIRQFGSYGNDENQFCMAEFLVWEPRCENIFVSDSGNHRIVAFDPRQGNAVFAFGQRGVGEQEDLQWPRGVCVDERGNIFIADSGNKRISRFTADGCFIDHVVSPINAPYTISIENGLDSSFIRKSKSGIFLNVTTFSLQNKAQLLRYSI